MRSVTRLPSPISQQSVVCFDELEDSNSSSKPTRDPIWRAAFSYAHAVTTRRMLVLLAPMGTLAAHGLAYWSQGGGEGLHGYLHFLGLPLVAALVVCWVIAAPGARTTALPSVRALATAQLGFYAAQETLERAVHSDGIHQIASQLLSSPAVRAGVVLQLVVAVVGLAVLRAARGVIGRATELDWPTRLVTVAPAAPATALVPATSVVRTCHLRCTGLSRAPPFGFEL